MKKELAGSCAATPAAAHAFFSVNVDRDITDSNISAPTFTAAPARAAGNAVEFFAREEFISRRVRCGFVFGNFCQLHGRLHGYSGLSNAIELVQKIRETGKVYFTNPKYELIENYNEGNYFLHCGAPYYDADGNFAGGVGVGAEVDYLYHALVDFNSDEPTIGIIVNQHGKIIMSSEKDGLFAVGDRDMRLYEYDKLAKVFEKMTALENDIVSLKLNDKEILHRVRAD